MSQKIGYIRVVTEFRSRVVCLNNPDPTSFGPKVPFDGFIRERTVKVLRVEKSETPIMSGMPVADGLCMSCALDPALPRSESKLRLCVACYAMTEISDNFYMPELLRMYGYAENPA